MTSLATSVSLPGTIVIFTQMSGLAVLNALTMFVRLSVSGGVWLVQKLTTVAFCAHAAPVTADALAPLAAADALAAVLAPALAAVLAPGLAPPAQAPTANTTVTARTHRDRP